MPLQQKRLQSQSTFRFICIINFQKGLCYLDFIFSKFFFELPLILRKEAIFKALNDRFCIVNHTYTSVLYWFLKSPMKFEISISFSHSLFFMTVTRVDCNRDKFWIWTFSCLSPDEAFTTSWSSLKANLYFWVSPLQGIDGHSKAYYSQSALNVQCPLFHQLFKFSSENGFDQSC